MDFGGKLRDLGAVDIGPLQKAALSLSAEYWTARPLRAAVFAGGAHNAAESVIFRHEWTTWYSKRGFPSVHHSIADWRQRTGSSQSGMFPIMEERTDLAWVYTFSDYLDWQQLVWPIMVSCAAAIDPEPKGVMIRAGLVRLRPGITIEEHIDGQPVTKSCHRIHVPISNNPNCIYKIGGEEFVMTPGRTYDFNNCVPHSVRNLGAEPRVNLMLEYYPNPTWVAPAPAMFTDNIYRRGCGPR